MMPMKLNETSNIPELRNPDVRTLGSNMVRAEDEWLTRLHEPKEPHGRGNGESAVHPGIGP